MIYLITHDVEYTGVQLFFVETDFGDETVKCVANAISNECEHPTIVCIFEEVDFYNEPEIVTLDKYIYDNSWWKDDDQIKLHLCNKDARELLELHLNQRRK